MISNLNLRINHVVILLTASVLPLKAQTSCGNVTLTDSSDGQFLIGSSTGSALFNWTLNGQSFWTGSTPQLGLFHFDGGLTNTAGWGPSTAVGQWFGAGRFGNAVGVSPGGLLQYPGNGSISFGDGTIEMWIAPVYAGNSATYSAHDHSLLRYWTSSGDQLMLSEGATGGIYGGTSVGGSTMVAGGGSISGWAAGQWHHVALTYSVSRSRVRIYIDGVMANEYDIPLRMPAAGGYFTVDGDAFGHNSDFLIDEMRLLNTEMTPQEIQSDAARTGPFADNEVYAAVSSLTGGQIGFQAWGGGALCGAAAYWVAPLTNISPANGLLPPGSSSFPLSFSSPQPSTCRYSVGATANWSSMQPFDTGPVSWHSGIVYGVSTDPRVVNTVNIACDINPAYVTKLWYRVPAAPSGQYPRIGNIWTGEYVYENSPAAALKTQLFLGAPFTPAEATAIRAANPGVLILPAVNASEAVPSTPPIPDSYFLKDIYGHTIQDWPGSWVLNLTNPAVVQFVATYAAGIVGQSGYPFDGIFFDNVRTTISNIHDMWGNAIAVDANGDGVADNPATLDAAWNAGVYQMIALFRQLAPNAYVSGHLGQTPPGPSSLSAFNGDALAFPLSDVREGTTAFPSLLNAYQTWFSAGQSPAITLLEASPPNQIAYGYGFSPLAAMPSATSLFGATFYPNMRFGLATSLMGDGFSAYDLGDTAAKVNWWYDEYGFNLGTPLGPAVQISSTAPANILSNPGFESGFAGWTLGVNSPANGWVVPDTSLFAEGNQSAHIGIATAGYSSWQVELEHPNVPLTAGVTYQLQFWARTSAPRAIALNAMGGAPGYPQYGLASSVAIDTTWRQYSVSFVATATANDGRLQFYVGDIPGEVWIDYVQLYPATTSVYRRDFTNGAVLLNGSPTSQTVNLEAGLQRFSGSQAPLYQYIVDDTDPSFNTSGAWSAVTYDTGYSSTGGGEVASGPYYHAWNRTAHKLAGGSGAAQWSLKIPADGTYTIQVWLPAAPDSSTWTRNASYQIVEWGSVVASFTLDQTTASAGDQWHSIGSFWLSAASNPQLLVVNGGSAAMLADAVYVYSAALYNNGAAAPSVTLAPMDGILLQRQIPAAQPSTMLGKVVNSVTWQNAAAPSSLISLIGYGFTNIWATYSAGNGWLPMAMGGVSATVNGASAAVFSVSPGQVMLVTPDDNTIGTVPVQLTANGATYSGTVTLQKFAPALFSSASGGIAYGQAVHANGTPVSPSAPAAPGETIVMLASGLGATNPPTPANQVVTVWSPVAQPVTVTIGGVTVAVWSAVKVSPGCYEITVTIPASMTAGNQAVQIGIAGFQSPAGVFVPVN